MTKEITKQDIKSKKKELKAQAKIAKAKQWAIDKKDPSRIQIRKTVMYWAGLSIALVIPFLIAFYIKNPLGTDKEINPEYLHLCGTVLVVTMVISFFVTIWYHKVWCVKTK